MYTEARKTFCSDLRSQLEVKTERMMAEDTLSIAEKLKMLGELTGRPSDFNIDSTLASINRAAKEQSVVAALVHCNIVPCTEAVFLGYLDEENPLTLHEDGRYSISVLSGQIARVHTTSEVRDGGRFQIAHRYRVHDDEPDPITIEDRVLDMLPNEIYNESRSFTATAENILNQAAGLDFKITEEYVNLPRIEENGDLLETYDRLNIVKGLGENTFRSMWSAVVHASLVEVKTK